MIFCRTMEACIAGYVPQPFELPGWDGTTGVGDLSNRTKDSHVNLCVGNAGPNEEEYAKNSPVEPTNRANTRDT